MVLGLKKVSFLIFNDVNNYAAIDRRII
jgi:hypothetical protein